MKIRVFAGPRIVDICDAVSVRRYIGAANAEVVRKRKTGQIVQVNLLCTVTTPWRSPGRQRSPDLREARGSRSLVMLKCVDPETGQLVRWSDRDRFQSVQIQSGSSPGIHGRRPPHESVWCDVFAFELSAFESRLQSPLRAWRTPRSRTTTPKSRFQTRTRMAISRGEHKNWLRPANCSGRPAGGPSDPTGNPNALSRVLK